MERVLSVVVEAAVLVVEAVVVAVEAEAADWLGLLAR